MQLKWCKGHATEYDVTLGHTTDRLRELNGLVDKLVGLGSDWAQELVPNVAERKAYRRPTCKQGLVTSGKPACMPLTARRSQCPSCIVGCAGGDAKKFGSCVGSRG